MIRLATVGVGAWGCCFVMLMGSCGDSVPSEALTPAEDAEAGTAPTQRDGGGPAASEAGGIDGSEGNHLEGGRDAIIDGNGVDRTSNPGDAPTSSVSFKATKDVFLNPERGFYRAIDVVNDRDLQWVRSQSASLGFTYVRLDDVRTTSITNSIIDGMNAGLAAARSAGIKVILRFAYNFGPYPNSAPDAPKTWVLQHIQQLKSHLQNNADVLLLVQAGFIGAWGEWHTSTNHLDNPTDRKVIAEALLSALPTSLMIQLRYPPHKLEIFGGPLSDAHAFDGSFAARTGHHNDCFLANDTDMGTYPGGEEEKWKQFLEKETRYLPMGGETCAVDAPRSDCPVALAEMERMHYSFINNDYHEGVVAAWKTQGCYETMQRGLGYRFALVDADVPSAVRPGGSFRLRVKIKNEGWASPFNKRPVYIRLLGSSVGYKAVLPGLDARRWGPGQETQIQVRLRVPSTAPAGQYRLGLWLPDQGDKLRDRAEYAIHLAADGVWDATSGVNNLASVQIDSKAPGGSVHSAADLAVIP